MITDAYQSLHTTNDFFLLLVCERVRVYLNFSSFFSTSFLGGLISVALAAIGAA